MAVVRSHFDGEWTREAVYAASNAIAAWLGLDSWVDVVTMQNPENVKAFRRMLAKAK